MGSGANPGGKQTVSFTVIDGDSRRVVRRMQGRYNGEPFYDALVHICPCEDPKPDPALKTGMYAASAEEASTQKNRNPRAGSELSRFQQQQPRTKKIN